MSLDVTLIPILKDNYSYLLTSGSVTAIVDPGEAEPIIAVLKERGLLLDYILNTHHHGDHIAGNGELQKRYNAQLVGPAKEAQKIGNLDITLNEGDVFKLGESEATIIDTPGHTAGGICFYFSESGDLFSGDTLFSLGCGRLFEGTPADMFHSFEKLKALPDETLIYCGHEYTQSNAAFCQYVDPDNPALQARVVEINALRDTNQPTLPVDLGTEKETNVFLRAESVEDFAKLRRLKDNF